MKISHTRDTINPFFPCGMEGYNENRFKINQSEAQMKAAGEGDRVCQGLKDDVLLDTLIIEAGQRVVFYSLDVCICEKKFCDYVRNEVSKASGLPVDNICVSCSHTHNSPLTSHGIDDNQQIDEVYWEFIADKMVMAYKWASRYMQEVKVYKDEFKIQGYYCNRNRPGDYYYDKCIDLTFKNEASTPLVRVLNLACHPTLLGVQNLHITNDFFGVMRRYLQGINGTPVMIFNGEAGDVSPRLMKRGVDFHEAIRYGEGIGGQLVDKNHPVELEVSDVRIEKIAHVIDYEPKKSEWLLNKKAELEEKVKTLDPSTRAYKMAKTVMLYDVEDKLSKDHIHYEPDCYVYDFGGFRIVTVPSEIDSELGKRIRTVDDKPTFLNAYANGFFYYAVNKEEFGDIFESFVTKFPYGSADEMVDKIIEKY